MHEVTVKKEGMNLKREWELQLVPNVSLGFYPYGMWQLLSCWVRSLSVETTQSPACTEPHGGGAW